MLKMWTLLIQINLSEDTCTHRHTGKKKEKIQRERGRREERAVNTPLWCALKPHKMASNHNRDMLRREEVFSVWFTLKPSLIPVWWLPWVFAVLDLPPIALTQSNFWALVESPQASCLITNRKREEQLSTRTWLLEIHILGQSSLSKPVPLCSPQIIKRSVDGGGSEQGKQRRKNKSQHAFQSSKDGYKMLLSKCCLPQFSSCITSKQNDYWGACDKTTKRCSQLMVLSLFAMFEVWEL